MQKIIVLKRTDALRLLMYKFWILMKNMFSITLDPRTVSLSRTCSYLCTFMKWTRPLGTQWHAFSVISICFSVFIFPTFTFYAFWFLPKETSISFIFFAFIRIYIFIHRSNYVCICKKLKRYFQERKVFATIWKIYKCWLCSVPFWCCTCTIVRVHN